MQLTVRNDEAAARCGSERHEGGVCTLSEDRIRPAVLRDRLDRRQLRGTLSSKRAQMFGKGVAAHVAQ
jgi:hypothetical protein